MTLEQFVAAHGGPVVLLAGRGRTWLCRDGAMITDGPVFTPPAAEPLYRLQARRRYHQTILQRVTSDVAKLEAALRRPGAGMRVEPWAWPDDHEWIFPHYGPGHRDGQSALAHLRGIAEREGRTVAELDQEIGEPIFA